MTDYAALVRSVQQRLAAEQPRAAPAGHVLGACPACHIHVCLTHHKHKTGDRNEP